MARGTTGRSVQRAGATGGGRTYRGQVPVNWYAALVLIVVVGLVSIVYSRVEYRRTSTTVQPAVGTTWYAGIAFDTCGTVRPALAANTSSTGISTSGNGVLVIAPTKASEAGDNATLGRFVSGYKGLELTATSLRYPGAKTLTNGEKCPAGTPDAGKTGSVVIESWPNVESKSSTPVTDPSTFKIPETSLVVVGFVPSGTTLKKPASVEVALLQAAAAGASGSASSTTTPTSTTTPAASSTTTTTVK
jgi:hypothetical protein